MKETELAQHFIDYLSDRYEIYKEVPVGGIIDIVAVQGKIVIGVEVKVTLNFDVIGQAHANLLHCNYSYIAVPKAKSNHFGYTICKMLGIGVLVYDYKLGNAELIQGQVYEEIKPKLNRSRTNYILKNLKPYMKDSVAGSQNDRVTAFGNTVNQITQYVKRHPGCTVEQCLKEIEYHWCRFSAAKSSVYSYIHTGIIKTVRLENGKLYPVN